MKFQNDVCPTREDAAPSLPKQLLSHEPLLLQLSCESLEGELSVMDEVAEDELLDDLLALANSRVASALG